MMQAAISTNLLMLLCRATPEQLVEVERMLTGPAGETGLRRGGLAGTEDRGGGARARFAFGRSGRYWLVTFEGMETFALEDTLGARYLDYLLHHANVPISAYDLEVLVQPEKGRARPKDSIQVKLDADAVRVYLRELSRLRAERDGADEGSDEGEVDRLDKEIEAVEAQLKGGANTGDAGERARGNVSKAMAAVRRKLGRGSKAEKSFGEHLERFVSTGYQCMYSQEGGGIWG